MKLYLYILFAKYVFDYFTKKNTIKINYETVDFIKIRFIRFETQNDFKY